MAQLGRHHLELRRTPDTLRRKRRRALALDRRGSLSRSASSARFRPPVCQSCLRRGMQDSV
jgi:hypothetical protein